jgi:hypothetical protein
MERGAANTGADMYLWMHTAAVRTGFVRQAHVS